MKESAGVLIGKRAKFVGTHAQYFGTTLCRESNVARMVPRAAMRFGRKIRTIGFDQQTCQILPVLEIAQPFQHFDRLARVLKGHDAVERQIPTANEQLFCNLKRTRIAMENAAHVGISTNRIERIGVRFAIVYDDGQ